MALARAGGAGEVGVIETAELLALTKRKRFAKVEQVHVIPPYESEGNDTFIGLLSLTKLTTQALNRENSLPPSRPCDMSSHTPCDALSEAFTKRRLSGPEPKFVAFDKSMMNVGLSSASNRSITLRPWRSRSSDGSWR